MRTTGLSLEHLEPRLTMAASAVLANGVLSISGTSSDDQITIDRRNGQIQVVEVGGWFAAPEIDRIEIDLGDGDDTVTLQRWGHEARSVGEAMTITAGNGNDVLIRAGGKELYFGGEDDAVTLGKQGAVKVCGAGPDWFNKNVSDSSLRSLSRTAAVDKVFSRADMLDLFADVTPAAVVGDGALTSLQAIVGRTKFFAGLEYVRSLSEYVVNGCVANAHYQGSTLGDLTANSTGSDLQLLVNKWFLGLDHPNPHNSGAHGVLTYKVAAGNLFDGPPTYVQMDQGEDGDCYYLSAMSSIITQDPSKVVNMFIDNGDDTWTVRFFQNSQPYYVTVDKMLPVDAQDVFVFANDEDRYDNPNNVLWPALAEKAFAQYAEFEFLDTGGPKNNSYGAINEGYPNMALHAILGTKVSSMMETGAASAKELVKAFTKGQPVVLVTVDTPPDTQIVSDHVYAMVGYNATTQKYELFNPWGIHHNTTGKPGYNYLTFEEIAQNFGYWGHGPAL
jgi:hypothetical protein